MTASHAALDDASRRLMMEIGPVWGHDPRFVRLAGHNHISLIAHFNTAEDYLGREIVEFTHRLA